MGELYIVAAEEAAGKTAICAGLAINLLNTGKKVGYLKLQAAQNDDDISLMKNIPGLEIIANKSNPLKGKDVVLAEARLGKKAADTASKEIYAAAKEMKARVIVVDAYPTKSVGLYQGFGESLMGIIINKVPPVF